jgi:hypothetical protein
MSRIENGRLHGLSENLIKNKARLQVIFSPLDEARHLRERQQKAGLPVGGPPVEMPGETLDYLYRASRASYDSKVGKLVEPGSVTRLLERQAPHLGSVLLNFPEVNKQLEDRLKRGWRLPFAFDVFYIVKNGKPNWAITEVQTAIWPVVRQKEFIRAAGYNPESRQTWLGETTPYEVFSTIPQETQGEPVTVIDMDPIRQFADNTYIARALGGNFAISPLDIKEDPLGYYYHEYEVDPDGKPIKDTKIGEYKKTQEKVRILYVIDRMGQLDLDELDNVLQNNPQQRELILKFMKDPRLTWYHHTSWNYVIEKQTMKDIRNSLIDSHSPYRDLYVPIFAPGEQIPPGTYIIKPSGKAQGKGQSIKKVAPGESFFVPIGHVAQEEFLPYPIPISLPGELAGAFTTPTDIPTAMVDFLGWDHDFTPGTFELRITFLPGYGVGAVPTAKLASRWVPQDERNRLETNLSPIKTALRNNQNELVSSVYTDYLPFGAFLPVVKRQELS